MKNKDLKKNIATSGNPHPQSLSQREREEVAPAAPLKTQKVGAKKPAAFSLPEGSACASHADRWKEVTLGEVVEIKNGGTPSTKNDKFWNGNIPWITPKDLSGYDKVFIEAGERSITKLGLENSSAQLLPKNTILFSSRAPIGYVVIAKTEMTTNQGFKNLICDEEKSHFKYFCYLMKYKSGYIEKLSSGSTFSEASASLIKSIDILLPPLPQQKAIAKMLSAFDDKIELLRKQNETLEKIGETIFKEYFSLKNPHPNPLPEGEGGLPDGWRVGKLSEIADFLNGLALQKYPPRQGEENLPVIKIKELKQGITENTDRANTDLDEKYIVKNGDVLFSWSGSLEVVIWTHGKGALNQHLFKVTSDSYPKWFYYYWLLHHLREFKQVAATKATTMGHINRKHLDLAEVLIPDNKTMDEIGRLLASVLEKFENNSEQIQTLAKTRDTLLPKLMKGEILLNNLTK